MHYIEKTNPTDETIPCVRARCAGVEPWTLSRWIDPRSTDAITENHVVTADVNGYWVGDDDTSECPDSERGHEVDGSKWEVV